MVKVILTESQMQTLLLEQRLAYILQESLNESKTFDEVKRKVLKALALGVSVAVIIAAISKMNISHEQMKQLTQMVEDQTEMVDTTGFAKKVKDVEAYMKFALGNQGYSMESTGLKPETLVRVSMEKGFDLPFMMAQAHQESCFGATPRARKTNSVFSVGSYDNGKNTKTYADPNDSVEDYVNLIQNKYLVDGKTFNDLLEPGNFVNGGGYRYASDKKYEGKIKSLRNLIIKKFPDLAS